MIDDHEVPIIGGARPDPAPEDTPEMRAASVPLLIVRLSPEGFLEAMVNVPPDGIPVLYQNADHIAKLQMTLQIAAALIETLREDLPLSVTREGERPA